MSRCKSHSQKAGSPGQPGSVLKSALLLIHPPSSQFYNSRLSPNLLCLSHFLFPKVSTLQTHRLKGSPWSFACLRLNSFYHLIKCKILLILPVGTLTFVCLSVPTTTTFFCHLSDFHCLQSQVPIIILSSLPILLTHNTALFQKIKAANNLSYYLVQFIQVSEQATELQGSLLTE